MAGIARTLAVGAIFLFLTSPADGQEGADQPQIGVHFGTDVTGGIDDFGQNRLGVQAVVPIRKSLSLSTGFSWFFKETQLDGTLAGGLRTTISRWQTWAGVRTSPIGEVWYLGVGVSYSYASSPGLVDRPKGLHDFFQAGADFAVGPAHPFVEVQLHDVLTWGRLNLLGGLNMSLP